MDQEVAQLLAWSMQHYSVFSSTIHNFSNRLNYRCRSLWLLPIVALRCHTYRPRGNAQEVWEDNCRLFWGVPPPRNSSGLKHSRHATRSFASFRPEEAPGVELRFPILSFLRCLARARKKSRRDVTRRKFGNGIEILSTDSGSDKYDISCLCRARRMADESLAPRWSVFLNWRESFGFVSIVRQFATVCHQSRDRGIEFLNWNLKVKWIEINWEIYGSCGSILKISYYINWKFVMQIGKPTSSAFVSLRAKLLLHACLMFSSGEQVFFGTCF